MRRGLVIMGGGAKGAYSLGAMIALKERGFTFEAVSGTSAGALNATIWGTGDLSGGARLWAAMDSHNSYDRIPVLKKFPRLMSRLLGSVIVIISLLVSRVYGSPIDGENDNNVDLLLFMFVFLYVIVTLGLI
ncbi:MAG: hypothetical protein B7Y43_12760 [Sphingomonas sp. 28-62-20]|uniref:patatin-like phospholipase family protein n=1 Tax=Sphingomonas sp. 28-62-20 TaxID=1970433 RepID=UPI000BD59174|nr:MAG: hypothetical protein B7Y43_12760 [Sphingomonas sp. 28-62-20]